MNDKIHNQLDAIESYLMVDASDDPNELKERISKIAVYHTTLGRILVDSKRELRKQKVSELSKQIVAIAKQNFLSAKAQNALVDSICIEQQYLVERVERLQSSCVHDLDASRSIFSYVKEEMRNHINQ